MAGRTVYLRPKELFGVVKLFDLGGKVVNAIPYFGRGDMKFGRTDEPYLLASAALVTPERFIPIDMGWYWDTIPAGATFKVSNFRINH